MTTSMARCGFLVKDMGPEDTLPAIRVVAVDDAMIAPGVTRRVIGQFSGQFKSMKLLFRRL